MQTTTTTTSKQSRPGIQIGKRIATIALYCVGLAIMTAFFGRGLVFSIQNGVLVTHLLNAAPFLAFIPALVIYGRIMRKARANNETPSREFIALGVGLAVLSACGIMYTFFSATFLLPNIIIACSAGGVYIARTLLMSTRRERKAC